MYYRRRLNEILDKLKSSVHTRIAARYSLIVPRFGATGRVVKVKELDREIEEAYAPILEEADEQAVNIASEFITRAGSFTRTALIAALAAVGISTRGAVGVTSTSKEAIGREVNLIRPPNMDAVLSQSIRDNVDLIRSIPRYDKLRIERMVHDSIRQKRDLSGLQEELQGIEDIGYRRAKIIARDQNNKVTEDITLERNKALGITQGVWIHRGGSKEPRETHMAFNGQIFDLDVGLYDSDVGEYVLPGELISCRCTFKPVIPDTL